MSDTEGFCIVVAEAMSAGLPVVATDVGGIRDYGVEGANMLKLNKVDTGSLVAALHRLMSDEEFRRRLGEAGRRDMRRDYSTGAVRARGAHILG